MNEGDWTSLELALSRALGFIDAKENIQERRRMEKLIFLLFDLETILYRVQNSDGDRYRAQQNHEHQRRHHGTR